MRTAAFAICLATWASAGVCQDRQQFWRWVDGGRGPAAEWVMYGEVVFRARCRASRELEIRFKFDPAEVAPKYALEDGVSIVLQGADLNERSIKLRSTVSGSFVTGSLKLTPAVAADIAASPYVFLYGTNGPSNNYGDSDAVAFRRIVRECAAR